VCALQFIVCFTYSCITHFTLLYFFSDVQLMAAYDWCIYSRQGYQLFQRSQLVPWYWIQRLLLVGPSELWFQFLNIVRHNPTYLINFMEQSTSWEADSYSASWEIPHVLWNLKVHYHVHRSPLLVPILSQMIAVHTYQPCFPKIHSNIFLSVPRSSMWYLPFRFSDKNFVCFLIAPMHAAYPTHLHLPWLDHCNIWWSNL